MGHRKLHAPRRGSLGVRPRKRAEELTPRVRTWPAKTWAELLLEKYGKDAEKHGVVSKPALLGFAAYKAGMTHALMVEDRPRTPFTGKEVFTPVTILDAPPMVILGLRAYGVGEQGGLVSLGEAWRSPVEAVGKAYEEYYSKNPLLTESVDSVVRKYLQGLRKLNHGLVKPDPTGKYGFKFVETNWEEAFKKVFTGNVVEVRALASTIPVLSGFAKKKPEIVEIKIGGGGVEEIVKYGESVLGGLVTVRDVFTEGQFIDVIGVTKGRGFQGVVKRFGVKVLPRWHKHRKGARKIGSRSPAFGTMSEPPQAGQTGFHRRTDYNKRILRIGFNGLEVTPSGGFLHYGLVYGPYLMLKGTVFGPAKRLLILRHPVRPPTWLPLESPRITYLNLESKQGV
jgi:large subunit ribosomal protein L3